MTAVHLSLVGKPIRSAHTRLVSGPSTKIAMARALALKAMAVAPVVWEWVKRGVALVAKTPGWVGHVALGALSTSAGYASALQAVSTGVRFSWRLVDRAVCLTGRGLATVTGLAASGMRHVTPTWGEALVVGHADLVDAVNAAHEHASSMIKAFGETVEQLAHTSLVKATSTRAAAVASALLVAHVITKGVLATKALTVAPALAGLIVAATSPWWLLLAVAAATVGALVGVAYLGVGKTVMPEPLVVNIAADGRVTVVGLPRPSSKAEQEQVAEMAAVAAVDTLLTAADTNSPTSSRPRGRRRINRASSRG